jgi:hypothetical protein
MVFLSPRPSELLPYFLTMRIPFSGLPSSFFAIFSLFSIVIVFVLEASHGKVIGSTLGQQLV